jgi:hypothetical protein
MISFLLGEFKLLFVSIKVLTGIGCKGMAKFSITFPLMVGIGFM